MYKRYRIDGAMAEKILKVPEIRRRLQRPPVASTRVRSSPSAPLALLALGADDHEIRCESELREAQVASP